MERDTLDVHPRGGLIHCKAQLSELRSLSSRDGCETHLGQCTCLPSQLPAHLLSQAEAPFIQAVAAVALKPGPQSCSVQDPGLCSPTPGRAKSNSLAPYLHLNPRWSVPALTLLGLTFSSLSVLSPTPIQEAWVRSSLKR